MNAKRRHKGYIKLIGIIGAVRNAVLMQVCYTLPRLKTEVLIFAPMDHYSHYCLHQIYSTIQFNMENGGSCSRSTCWQTFHRFIAQLVTILPKCNVP